MARNNDFMAGDMSAVQLMVFAEPRTALFIIIYVYNSINLLNPRCH